MDWWIDGPIFQIDWSCPDLSHFITSYPILSDPTPFLIFIPATLLIPYYFHLLDWSLPFPSFPFNLLFVFPFISFPSLCLPYPLHSILFSSLNCYQFYTIYLFISLKGISPLVFSETSGGLDTVHYGHLKIHQNHIEAISSITWERERETETRRKRGGRVKEGKKERTNEWEKDKKAERKESKEGKRV